MKAIIVTDFAYKGPKRKGRGTGHKGLRSTLKYLQFRDNRDQHLRQDDDAERWVDHGMGQHYRAIFEQCDRLQSKHVLAWTWVISPAPDLMALVPEDERRDLVLDLTERIVEDYYTARGFDVPEYSYVLHDRLTEPDDGSEPLQQLHTHVVLPGTAPLPGVDRAPVYNNKERGHDALFRDIASRHFGAALDRIVGPEWQRLREEAPEIETPTPTGNTLDDWFSR
ncbi:MAG: hypothetical protein H6672_08630 [Anaerolineaceae bacterium]|nr:hypothetical protein [Anaerolineaceae bacterium]